MKPESQRIAIAEACGWKLAYYSSIADDRAVYYAPNSIKTTSVLPDYLNDLNAMHEAEKQIASNDKMWAKYERELGCAIQVRYSRDWRPMWHATAAQRAEAFLHTLGLWK